MTEKLPDFDAGVAYWTATSADVNGVLGGYGEGTPVPRLDATSSRLLILSLLPQLSTISPPHLPPSSAPSRPSRPFRALDCGAGIGRVTSTVLLPLFDLVDLVEPVEPFVVQAQTNALQGKEGWKWLHVEDESKRKGVRIWRAGLQHFDPLAPARPVKGELNGEEAGTSSKVELFAKLGKADAPWPEPAEDLKVAEEGYDLIMVQWCIGHLSDSELVAFLQRSRRALRQRADGTCEGYIIVKENVCKDTDGDGVGKIFDEDDSSITRSDKAFREVFERAGLTIVRREVQRGFPAELFPVVAYALR
ncbi:Alpha N-terminal protein methyltransferase 1 [Rhodotorula toruloides]|uniref:Alpha N-terminal protein methyltransferase 1 n=1 Tax=Rhodotorula toruloides TaxID=5286 RepID=A0A0K3CDR4_RHOTO|nr:Alpha N-terminal protein methyltransferase 1 [Rhodotorula toruloides]PRQ73655.1 Alpha-N-methyltransferase NTM1 [Rhodotorula toruloides]